MLWNREPEKPLPKELEGLTPEQIVERLRAADAAVAAKTQSESEKTAAETARAELQTRLEAAEARTRELEEAAPPPPPPDKNEPPNFFADPAAAVDAQTKGIHDTAIFAGMLAAKLSLKEQLPKRDLAIFNKFDKEISAIVNAAAPQSRVLPQTWLNALMYVKGFKEGEIREMESKGSLFFSETGGSPPPPEPPLADKLTEEEAAVCKAMRWDPESYLKRRKTMKLEGNHATFGV